MADWQKSKSRGAERYNRAEGYFMKYSFLVLVFAASLFAQTTGDCRERTVLVSALDAHGSPISNLTASDFRVSYRGRPATIVSSQYNQNPSGRVVVLLDASGSMAEGVNDSNKWKIARFIASEFVSSAPPRMQVSFMSFADAVQQKFDAAIGRQAIQDWLSTPSVRKGEQVRGQTALYEAMMAAINDLGPAEPGDAIYVITDGGDNSSKAKSSMIESSLLNSGIRLFAFVLRSSITRDIVQGTLTMDDLARRSGGFMVNVGVRYRFPDGTEHLYDENIAKDIKDATRLIQTQISDFYILRIDGPDQLAKAKDWTLDLVDAQGHKRKDITLRYSHSPPNCSQPAAR